MRYPDKETYKKLIRPQSINCSVATHPNLDFKNLTLLGQKILTTADMWLVINKFFIKTQVIIYLA